MPESSLRKFIKNRQGRYAEMVPEKTEENVPTSVSSSAKPAGEDDSSAELPPIQSEPITALLPIYNDRATLQPTLEAWISVLNSLNRDYEIILVDDASTDGSLDLAQTLAEKNPRVRPMRHETHAGFGACLRTGLESARFPLLLISTCDGCYQPAELTRFLKWIDKVHLVAGYRSMDSKRYKRNWGERLYHWVARIIFGLRLKDPECWFFLARRLIFSRIPIQSTGPFAFAELLAKANFLGCLMSEAPVSYQPIPGANAKWSNSTLREKLTGFRRVFSHPDFGPAKLPEK
jgi:glycosyltransferase involved in cell wall biosynthesis